MKKYLLKLIDKRIDDLDELKLEAYSKSKNELDMNKPFWEKRLRRIKRELKKAEKYRQELIIFNFMRKQIP